jgi:hypothetical protein
MYVGSHIQNAEALHRIFIWITYSLLFIFTFCSHLYTNVLLKKLLTGFLYELQPSLHTYTLLYLHIPECVLVKHLLHVSTEFVFYLTTVISHRYSVASGQLIKQTMLIHVSSNQQLLDQNRTLYVTSCSQHSMEGQNTPRIVLPLPCSFTYMSTKHEVTDKFPTRELCLLIRPT